MGAALGGWPAPVIALTAVRAARLSRALANQLPGAGAWAIRAAVDVSVREAHDLGRALAGAWAPLAPAVGHRRLGPLLAAKLVRAWLADHPRLDSLSYALLRLAGSG